MNTQKLHFAALLDHSGKVIPPIKQVSAVKAAKIRGANKPNPKHVHKKRTLHTMSIVEEKDITLKMLNTPNIVTFFKLRDREAMIARLTKPQGQSTTPPQGNEGGTK